MDPSIAFTYETMIDLSASSVRHIEGVPRAGVAWKAAIVIQGPYYAKSTKIVIEEMRSRNSDILIILSTYLPPEEESGEKRFGSFLSDSERDLVKEGYLILVLVKPPIREECPEFWRTNTLNRNLQRLTTFCGLQHAQSLGIEFSLKTRSDTFLGRRGIINHLIAEVRHDFPVNPEAQDVQPQLKGRIAVSAQGTISNPATWVPDPYHIREHWMFGYTEDLLRYFDIRAEFTHWENGSGLSSIHNPESSLAQLWIKDLKLKVSTPGELLGRYMITEDATFTEQVRLEPRYPGWNLDYSRYIQDGAAYLQEIYATTDTPCCVTSHADWLKLRSAFASSAGL